MSERERERERESAGPLTYIHLAISKTSRLIYVRTVEALDATGASIRTIGAFTTVFSSRAMFQTAEMWIVINFKHEPPRN